MERKDEVGQIMPKDLRKGPECPTCGNPWWSIEEDVWYCSMCGQMRIFNEESKRDS